MFKLSGFGDEISSDLATQLEVMETMGIKHLELRGIKGENVFELNNEEIEEARQILKEKYFDGFLSLEPHLAISGKMSGFSGAKLFKKAAKALKEILEEI